MKIITPQDEHVYSILGLMKQLAIECGSTNGRTEAWFIRSKIKSGTIRIAIEDDVVLGVLMFRKYPKSVWVSDLIVKSRKRGHGVGRRLIRNIEGLAKRYKTLRVELNSIKTAIGFYKRAGFRISIRWPSEACKMTKRLSQ